MELKAHTESTDTAQKHMIRNFCTAAKEDTPESYLKKMRASTAKLENTPYIYVIDEHEKLLGVVSFQQLFTADPSKPFSILMEKNLVTVRPHTDREHVALLAIEKHLKAIPVIDAEEKFLGVVPENSIYQILQEEHVEDFIRAAGIHHAGGSFIDVLHAKTSKILKARIPWLIIGFIGGIGATFVVKFFETSLERQIGLAFFIPIILYMADATGTQSETLFLRSEALAIVNVKKYLLHELSIGPAIGLIIGSLTFLFALLLFRDKLLAFAIGFSMFAAILISVFVAILIPVILMKFKKDPAVGSGPFATVIQDILSLVIYFAVATLLLG